ncbi:hypothetical protein RRG08_015591 [Elysia crispata]|uniref:Uncharacterized protein n=1 Tax=Elysia crispata TaxID=231223 RepID=A0AAE1CWN4_9GAST|nr:hypothetical protein RRG08_015591 [Elysia crispata]
METGHEMAQVAHLQLCFPVIMSGKVWLGTYPKLSDYCLKRIRVKLPSKYFSIEKCMDVNHPADRDKMENMLMGAGRALCFVELAAGSDFVVCRFRRAPKNKRIIILIDDLNMPKLDSYGSQPPIELLRQYLDFHGLYDRETMKWKEVQDVTLSAACSPPGGGRNPVSARLFRHFTMLCIPPPTEDILKHMFTLHPAEEVRKLSRSTDANLDSNPASRTTTGVPSIKALHTTTVQLFSAVSLRRTNLLIWFA